ncbi:hypothetical protein JDV02_000336 [Purpureocillium takamizusanense]|uniref:Uncharacterized protein n=1 Tax=Purpureocillium takamizusanense TaxID=2060973 RepID=A0A9Q8V694_9HYPO|nr:uncharacterized protein JDV02_000336 [Purpureocillium takamizusanense]UNI13609.1 hypothetical protein JDV02_000336 [Purpureocillium takamizusanense]
MTGTPTTALRTRLAPTQNSHTPTSAAATTLLVSDNGCAQPTLRAGRSGSSPRSVCVHVCVRARPPRRDMCPCESRTAAAGSARRATQSVTPLRRLESGNPGKEEQEERQCTLDIKTGQRKGDGGMERARTPLSGQRAAGLGATSPSHPLFKDPPRPREPCWMSSEGQAAKVGASPPFGQLDVIHAAACMK